MEVGYSNGGIYTVDDVMRLIQNHVTECNEIRARENKPPLQHLVIHNELPTRQKSRYNYLKIPDIQASHCLTYFPETETVKKIGNH